MNLEKPISTIRKAIENKAEEVASREFLDKPEQRHYEKAFNIYRFMRMFEPERIEKVIEIAAQEKEMKDQMGLTRYNVFTQVWEKLIEEYESKVGEAIRQLKETKMLSPKELIDETLKVKKRFFKVRADELKNDPRITAAFSGKEELLDKSIESTIIGIIDLLEIDENTPPRYRFV